MRYMCHSQEKWSTKMVHTLSLLLVSFPLKWTMNPMSMQIIWSMETHSPDFVALKMDVPWIWNNCVHGFFPTAPKSYPAHIGGLVLERYLGILSKFSHKSSMSMQCELKQFICHKLEMMLGLTLYWMRDWDWKRSNQSWPAVLCLIDFGLSMIHNMIFICNELRLMFHLALDYARQYSGFFIRTLTCVQSFIWWSKGLIVKTSRCEFIKQDCLLESFLIPIESA